MKPDVALISTSACTQRISLRSCARASCDGLIGLCKLAAALARDLLVVDFAGWRQDSSTDLLKVGKGVAVLVS